MIESGAVRINKVKTTKISHPVKPGDILTLAIGPQVTVVKVLAEPDRRGPANMASKIFEQLEAGANPADSA